jgi:type VI protein secretion system component VasK
MDDDSGKITVQLELLEPWDFIWAAIIVVGILCLILVVVMGNKYWRRRKAAKAAAAAAADEELNMTIIPCQSSTA